GVSSDSTNPTQSTAEHIRILSKYGNVLTDFLKSSTTVDMHGSDDKIYENDMKLIKKCDIYIADVTNPSLGVGYTLGKAEELNKLILCLCYKDKSKSKEHPPKISAMINGNNKLTKMF